MTASELLNKVLTKVFALQSLSGKIRIKTEENKMQELNLFIVYSNHPVQYNNKISILNSDDHDLEEIWEQFKEDVDTNIRAIDHIVNMP